MDMIRVISSDLKSIGYENGTLYVMFRNGKTYSYSGVPYDVFTSLLNAESKGKFFSKYIRNVYPCTKL